MDNSGWRERGKYKYPTFPYFFYIVLKRNQTHPHATLTQIFTEKIIMNRITLSSLDYQRIYDSIGKAQEKGAISKHEAESLAAELEQAKIVEPQEMPDNVVTMNSKVKIMFVNSGKKIEIKIVYPQDADINNNLISIFSPIAAALIGYKEGDTIDWIVPSGPTRIKVEEITYQPEASGQYDV